MCPSYKFVLTQFLLVARASKDNPVVSQGGTQAPLWGLEGLLQLNGKRPSTLGSQERVKCTITLFSTGELWRYCSAVVRIMKSTYESIIVFRSSSFICSFIH